MNKTSFFFSLILVLAAEAVLLNLAHWQYGRLLEQRALYAQATDESREVLPLDVNSPPESWQKVKLSGVYTHSREKVLINQRLEKHVGIRIVTPMEVNGQTLLVDRGWVPTGTDVSAFRTQGVQSIEGVVRTVKPRSGVFQGPVYGVTQQEIMRVEAEPFGLEEEPTYYVQATKSPFAELKAVAAVPKNGDQNLEYMWTWLILATILPLMYGYLLWTKRK